MGRCVSGHVPTPWTHVNRVDIWLTILIKPAGIKRVQVQEIALLERGIQVTRSTSIRGHCGCIVMDDSDGIIMRSGWIDLSVYAWSTGLGAPVTDAQRWVQDTFPLELPA